MSNKLHGSKVHPSVIYIVAEDGSYRRLGKTVTGGRYPTWKLTVYFDWEANENRLPDTILKLLGEEDDL